VNGNKTKLRSRRELMSKKSGNISAKKNTEKRKMMDDGQSSLVTDRGGFMKNAFCRKQW